MPDPLETVAAEELYRRGLALSEASDYVRAEQYFVAALERGHPEDEVMMPLVVACVRSDRLSAALRHAEPYLARHPGAWALRLVVATVQMALGEPQRARDELLQITRDAPREPAPHYMLGVLAREQLDGDAMRAHFARYLALEPEGPHAAEARAALADTPSTSASATEETAPAGTGPVRLAPHGEAPAGAAPVQGGNAS